ncbi:HEAT repeat domain-containing protein [Maioricimonas sp. JC845]|uniref:HEAT repeat domain-containing protein n=1 Tax=Maioricimonas sp. JC845 TaxID=3232138 RepID=UPI003459801A
MKSIQTLATVVVMFGMSGAAHAGLFDHFGGGGCDASKSCDCAPTFEPTVCKPVIVRPCHTNMFTYQRQACKPMACDTCAPNGACAPCGPEACGPAACAPECAAPCGPAACAPECAAPCAPECAAPCAPGCEAPCDPGCAAPCDPGCEAPCDPGCAAPCDDACVETACCPVVDACEIAELIYESQTACYAKHRRRAIQKLGNRYTCVCNPEIMAAFIYALNDADERVRKEAADEIGDQLRKYPCCCSPCVVQALTCALADCDRGVRRQAEEALEACGYEIVDGCCEVACDTTCAPGCAPSCAPAAAPAHPAPATPEAVPPMDGAAPAPAPAPPEEPKAYFPKRLPQQQARPISSSKSPLSRLFSLVD